MDDKNTNCRQTLRNKAYHFCRGHLEFQSTVGTVCNDITAITIDVLIKSFIKDQAFPCVFSGRDIARGIQGYTWLGWPAADATTGYLTFRFSWQICLLSSKFVSLVSEPESKISIIWLIGAPLVANRPPHYCAYQIDGSYELIIM